MQMGIVGLPYSGKSTLFSTLLCHVSTDGSYKARQETKRGVVKVPDERLDRLIEMYNPKSRVYSTVEYLKVPGLESAESGPRGLPAQFLANMRTADAILLLVRDFDNEATPHPFGRIDPRSDIAFANSELLFADLTIVESKIERMEKQLRKTPSDAEKRELDLLIRCRKVLEEGKPLRDFQVTDEEEKNLRGFQFLTAKPILYVINVAEAQIPNIESILRSFEDLKSPNSCVAALCASIEREVAELGPEDRDAFLQDLGIKEPALYNLINRSYELLGLISFFTVGQDECRAWTLRRGSSALKAAGVIHTDLERGFIRAEVVRCEALVAGGSMGACKAQGVVHLEGKDYTVQDGDVIDVRFSV